MAPFLAFAGRARRGGLPPRQTVWAVFPHTAMLSTMPPLESYVRRSGPLRQTLLCYHKKKSAQGHGKGELMSVSFLRLLPPNAFDNGITILTNRTLLGGIHGGLLVSMVDRANCRLRPLQTMGAGHPLYIAGRSGLASSPGGVTNPRGILVKWGRNNRSGR